LALALGLNVVIACVIFRFFWRPMLFAAVIGIGFYPLHEKIKKLIRRQNASALISTLSVLLIFVVLGTFLASAASGEIVRAAQYLNERAGQGTTTLTDFFHFSDRVSASLEKYVDLEKTGLKSAIASFPAKLSQLLFATARALVTGLASFLGQGAITLFILFFAFRDGAATVRHSAALLPLGRERMDRLFERIRDSVFANLYGILAVALAQGLLTGVAFAMLGIPSPILFGIVAAVFSLVPVVGPSLVWLAASVFLFVTGHWVKGIFLFAWGALVVGTADNVIRPLVVMGRAKLHPLILLFALVGGVQQFGFIGLFIGPVVMSLIFALVEMLQEQVSESRREPAALSL
jgi:predicted PurR-regulated permease PerM